MCHMRKVRFFMLRLPLEWILRLGVGVNIKDGFCQHTEQNVPLPQRQALDQPMTILLAEHVHRVRCNGDHLLVRQEIHHELDRQEAISP